MLFRSAIAAFTISSLTRFWHNQTLDIAILLHDLISQDHELSKADAHFLRFKHLEPILLQNTHTCLKIQFGLLNVNFHLFSQKWRKDFDVWANFQWFLRTFVHLDEILNHLHSYQSIVRVYHIIKSLAAILNYKTLRVVQIFHGFGIEEPLEAFGRYLRRINIRTKICRIIKVQISNSFDLGNGLFLQSFEVVNDN